MQWGRGVTVNYRKRELLMGCKAVSGKDSEGSFLAAHPNSIPKMAVHLFMWQALECLSKMWRDDCRYSI